MSILLLILMEISRKFEKMLFTVLQVQTLKNKTIKKTPRDTGQKIKCSWTLLWVMQSTLQCDQADLATLIFSF